MEHSDDSRSTADGLVVGADALIWTAAGLDAGTLLSGRFELGSLLGAGGMGSVYAARDRALTNREIAVKVLHPELLANQVARERFMREAMLSCSLSHPNIVRVYDVGISAPHIYFSMERLRGETLKQRVACRERPPLTLQEISSLARQLIEALQYAQSTIVHRDIKPDNIWLTEGNDIVVKLMDFGIARAVTTSELTLTGVLIGTPDYMAPEQYLAPRHVDWRADQYSLGIVLYELLTGKVPDATKSSAELAAKALARRPEISKRYVRALMRAIAQKPADRWPSWDALLAQLEAPHRKPIPMVAAVAGLCASLIFAAGAYLYMDSDVKVPTEPEVPLAKRKPRAARPPLEMRPPLPDPATVPTPSLLALTAPTIEVEPDPSLPAAPVPAPRELPADLSESRDLLKDGSRGPVMVVIPAGLLLMGSPETEKGRFADEGPQHTVTIEKFALARTEVTFEEYERFVQATGARRPDHQGWGGGGRPVINVTWQDARDYAAWLSEQTGKKYRLPSEAEWEYAARGRTRQAFSTGDCISIEQANFSDNVAYAGCPSSGQTLGKTREVVDSLPADLPTKLVASAMKMAKLTAPAKAFPANPFGLRHMHGNVKEWTEDCYHISYEGAPADGSAWLDQTDCTRHVLRGGGWSDNARNVRSAKRASADTGSKSLSAGFRLAKSL